MESCLPSPLRGQGRNPECSCHPSWPCPGETGPWAGHRAGKAHQSGPVRDPKKYPPVCPANSRLRNRQGFGFEISVWIREGRGGQSLPSHDRALEGACVLLIQVPSQPCTPAEASYFGNLSSKAILKLFTLPLSAKHVSRDHIRLTPAFTQLCPWSSFAHVNL